MKQALYLILDGIICVLLALLMVGIFALGGLMLPAATGLGGLILIMMAGAGAVLGAICSMIGAFLGFHAFLEDLRNANTESKKIDLFAATTILGLAIGAIIGAAAGAILGTIFGLGLGFGFWLYEISTASLVGLPFLSIFLPALFGAGIVANIALIPLSFFFIGSNGRQIEEMAKDAPNGNDCDNANTLPEHANGLAFTYSATRATTDKAAANDFVKATELQTTFAAKS